MFTFNKLFNFDIQECTRFVSVYSSIACPPVCEVFAIDWPNYVTSVHSIIVTSLGYLLEPMGNSIIWFFFPLDVFGTLYRCILIVVLFFSEPDENYRKPEIFVYNLPSQEPLYCMIFTPPNMQPGHKYPTVLSVYGGPEVQLVNNSFKGMR